MAAEKRKAGRPKGSTSIKTMTERLTVRLPREEYFYLAGMADSREKANVARLVRKAIRFYMDHHGGRWQPKNTDMAVTVVKDSATDTEENKAAEASVTAQPAPFNASKFALGHLCKRGHIWPGSANQTLRRLPSHVCPQCDTIDQQARRERKRNTSNIVRQPKNSIELEKIPMV